MFNIHVCAGPRVSLESPTVFFTNVASRLLQSELNLDLNRLQIYPTNQYTPAVHRLLQVTANLYDATTNRAITGYPYLPSVFRPRFTNDGGAVFITGYVEETGTNFLANPFRNLRDPADLAALQMDDNVRGVPLIIGAKKGFPNFNEFSMENAVQIQRRLQYRRPQINASVNETNQMYIVTITNVFGVEAWNSYSNAFPRDLQMIVAADIQAVMTNELGSILVSNQVSAGNIFNIPSSTWAGYDPNHPQNSFRIPLSTSFTFLPTSMYSPTRAAFVSPTDEVDRNLPGPFYVPAWWLNLNVQLRFVLVDNMNIVDFVNLNRSEAALDLTAALATEPTPIDERGRGLWDTNRVGAPYDDTVMTYGMFTQYRISFGDRYFNDVVWTGYNFDPSVPQSSTKQQAIGAFFFNITGKINPFYPGIYYRSNVFYAPYVPTVNRYKWVNWQANDPLVHHTIGDLMNLQASQTNELGTFPRGLPNLGSINSRYGPWGGNPLGSRTGRDYDLAAKDPVALPLGRSYGCSDDWNFPTAVSPDLAWIGRVHRGTPWQTIYLKPAGMDPISWCMWVGVADPREAQLLQPTNDWRIASLIVSLLSTNDLHTLASVNQTEQGAWTALLDGMTALTNTAPGQFDTVVISSNSPQAEVIASGINAARSRQPGQVFRDFGDILATTELSVASPWLNLTNVNFPYIPSISDEAYEVIPSQLLPLLRPDSIGCLSQAGGSLQIQFSGIDGYQYAVEISPDLVNWTAVFTNSPLNGAFSFLEMPVPGSRRFYRSVLLP